MKRWFILMLGILFLSTSTGFAEEEQNQTQQQEFELSIIPTAGPERVDFDIFLKNNSQQVLNFEFPTAQKYELEVKDSKGKMVYRYSEGKSFAQMIENLKLNPNEVKTWRETWDYRKDGKRVSEGEYKAEALLKAFTINRKPIKNRDQLKAEAIVNVPGENPVFKGLKVSGSAGVYTVTGQARPMQGTMFYTVEDGHNQYVAETKVMTVTKYPKWSSFKVQISLPKDKLPKNATLIMNLYEKSKNGEMIHTFPVVLEQFQ